MRISRAVVVLIVRAWPMLWRNASLLTGDRARHQRPLFGRKPMSDQPSPTHVRRSALELLGNAKVTRDGGSLRYLEGERYGLVTSVFEAEIVPGSGPRPHTHAYTEYFILHEGQGQYVVDETSIDAEAGDIVIVPAGVVHSFVNTGQGPLRHTAIHEAPVQLASFTDGDSASL